MTAKQILDSFSETLMQDERILSARERALLTSILQHAKSASSEYSPTNAGVNEAIAAAIGETVAQRAFAVLGGNVVERILAGTGNMTAAEDTTIYAMPLPPGPQPPSVRKPQDKPSGPQPPSGPHSPGDPAKGPGGPQPPSSPGGPHARADLKPATYAGHAEPQKTVGILEKPETLSAQCVVLDEFLAPQEVQELVRHTLEHEVEFETSEVISPGEGGLVDSEHRRSRVLMNLGIHENVVMERIMNVLPLVLARLGMDEFPIASVESQITASNDGDFFREHPDNGQEEVASRHLTFVYFFHREPRQFEGGELRIHDSRLRADHYVSTGSYQSIVPQQNRIVFFPCSLPHEITPVRCASGAFADSRFTLNGWLRR
jgi:Rps23 Pro-64 3,4-dihydroxylase Tpa1-like proline 4-hydroxylase